MGASCAVEALVKDYGGRRVVDEVSLTVAAGEFLVLLGPSGCGKTTTLRMIAGLEQPDSGRITIADRVVSDPEARRFVRPEHRGLGMVFQSYAIWPHMTVAGNVAFPLRARGLARGAELDRKVQDALRLVGLDGLENRPATALSGGQMQRVVLARAIVYDPQILLFDEPLSNLDLKMREHLRVELKALQARTGLTSIYVTHDQVEAVELADRIAVMEAGRIVQLGSPAEIYRRPATRFVAEFISSANIFTARVSAVVDDTTAEMTTPSGRRFAATYERPVQPGDMVDVVIHPEECELAPGEPGIPVRLGQVRFQGVSMRYTVAWCAEPFDVVVLGTAARLSPGEPVRLRIPAAAARILPGVTG